MTTAPSFDEVRSQFPILERWTYLNAASRGPLRTEVVEAIDAYYADYLREGPLDRHKHERQDKTERVRRKCGALIGASAEDIAFTKNITEGVNIVLHGLGLQAGDNVVVAPALEHPTIGYALSHLRAQGVEIRAAASPAGTYDVEEFARVADERTRLVCVSTVSFLTGARAPLAGISQLCRSVGAVFLVDGAQGLGVLDIDVVAEGVDALAGSAHKGIMGVPGIGYLYCRRALAERMTPVYLGRSGVQVPPGTHYYAAGGDLLDFQLAPGARRFELGHANSPAIASLEPCLDFLLGFGTRAVEDRVAGVADRLLAGLTERGLDVATPTDRARRGGTISFRCAQPRRVTEALLAAGIALAERQGLVRFGLHLYNNAADVDRVLAVLDQQPAVDLAAA